MLDPLAVLVCLFIMTAAISGQRPDLEKKKIASIDITFENGAKNPQSAEQFKDMIKDEVGDLYSATRIRDSIGTIYATKKVDLVVITADVTSTGDVILNYQIRRKPTADRVSVDIIKTQDDEGEITEQDLLYRLSILTPGTSISEQTLRNNADEILDYLRERGYLKAEVTFKTTPLTGDNNVSVNFAVTPGERVRIGKFEIAIDGYSKTLTDKIRLKPGEFYSRTRLTRDVDTIKSELRKEDFIAPRLDEPRIQYDSDNNTVSIELKGQVGPSVDITVEADKVKVGRAKLTELLPIKRDSTLDYAAIVEGERRLENHFQELGYFFAKVTPICSVDPPLAGNDSVPVINGTNFVCSALSGADLANKKVAVTYKADLNRKLKLVSIRVRGTNKFTYEDISGVLESQVANVLGIVPVLGYGRGVTSEVLLEEDQETVRSLMSELGYRNAQVRVNQGVAPNGEDLVITFDIDEGPPTVVEQVELIGNTEIPSSELMDQLPKLVGENYSRAKVRNGQQKLSAYYSEKGFFDARVVASVIEPPSAEDAATRPIKIEYKIEKEGKPVIVGRVMVSGNENTKESAIRRALSVKEGELLRSADIYASEQALFSSDAFERIDIKPQPAGNTTTGDRVSDIIVNVTEQKARLATYGVGYSTDLGANGFFDIRHVNFFGKLWQAGARVKVSQRQQLVEMDLVNPRFMRDGDRRFSPLTFRAQYQRDSTVTRFFRSAFDKGTFGIVQRVDQDGNPIDEFGARAGDPTINRVSLFAETSRTISRKNRSLLFARFKFEDVRLINFDSLLIKELLLPDSRIRTSGFQFTFVRDTRENCANKYTILDIIAKGESESPCRYNAGDPTRGDYLTTEYSVSLPALGANIGFHKFQATYNYYYTPPKLRNTTLAARVILGVGQVFSNGNRFNDTNFPGLNGILPISERFFAGGSNTIRGFDFEEAGPRVVIMPQGTFRDSQGNPVRLDPFTIPFGGNAMAITNLEARIPVTTALRIVPFYDGGNVFRRAKDIFKSPSISPTDTFGQNISARWTHTLGLGFRLRLPVGGEVGVDYGYMLNPPKFLIPQPSGPDAVYQLRRSQIHFRFSQAF